jgi:hypothetical protein
LRRKPPETSTSKHRKHDALQFSPLLAPCTFFAIDLGSFASLRFSFGHNPGFTEASHNFNFSFTLQTRAPRAEGRERDEGSVGRGSVKF